ncbi:hypothetical protein TH5_22750, partial [Thalassospira xianhensis MCCC 1A02616]
MRRLQKLAVATALAGSVFFGMQTLAYAQAGNVLDAEIGSQIDGAAANPAALSTMVANLVQTNPTLAAAIAKRATQSNPAAAAQIAQAMAQ